MPRFQDIPQFPRAHYSVNVSLDFLEENLEHYDRPEIGSPLILNPEWQRGHVWTRKQQTAFMEYFLKGGTTGRDIYFNCSSWGHEYNTPIYCVDGLQRLSAALAFMKDELRVFGHLRSEYTDRPRMIIVNFIFNMMNIVTKKDLLKVYIDFNSGGSPHNPKEIARIEQMMAETDPNETL